MSAELTEADLPTHPDTHAWTWTDAEKRAILRWGNSLLAAQVSAPGAPQEAAPELLRGWKRYEKARKLSPRQWAELHARNLAGETFDDMIDALPESSTPALEAVKDSLSTGGAAC